MSHCEALGPQKGSDPHVKGVEMEVLSDRNLQGADEIPCEKESVLNRSPGGCLRRQQWYLPLSGPFPLILSPSGPSLPEFSVYTSGRRVGLSMKSGGLCPSFLIASG